MFDASCIVRRLDPARAPRAFGGQRAAAGPAKRWSRCCLVLLSVLWTGCASCFDRSTATQGQPSVHPSRSAPPSQRVRRAAMAGAWYPRDAAALRRDLDGYLRAAPQVELGAPVVALVSPHAGYGYSGKAAAAGFRLLRGRDIRRVVVLAVSHRVPFAGASIADVTHYETPLGLIPVDGAAVARLRRSSVVGTVAEAHAREHSLEMQLPLLQHVLRDFQLVPVLLSRMTERDYVELAQALRDVLDEHTVVVASSDFTHRGPNYGYEVPDGAGEVAQRLARVDDGALEHILARDRRALLDYQQRTGTTICGLGPVATLLELLAGVDGLQGRLLDRYTSGDISGDWTNTVTYFDVAFSGRWPRRASASAVPTAPRVPARAARRVPHQAPAARLTLSGADKRDLLELARRSLHAAVRAGRFDPQVLRSAPDRPALQRRAGAFVTLKCRLGSGALCVGPGKDLRGCIGTILPVTAVRETVAQRAASAALQDSRFPHPVTTGELKHISVEVSVLTPPQQVRSPEAVEIGRHGIILSRQGRQATFLPQVAPEQGWDRDTTLSRLARKAGLSADGWRQAQLSVYEAIVFGDEH